MARYGDLYTPASNYGKVYRGSLASRQKSIEQAGDNMVNFAGEIYNLVQKEREAKAEARKTKMLEQEYLSQQNYRSSRIQQEKENQDFTRYQSQLKNLVSMHDTWIKQDDANMYKRWGGIARTRSAYQQRVKQIEKAIENAQTPAARRAVVMRYPGWFEHTKNMDQKKLNEFFEDYDHNLHMASAMPFSIVTEEDYVNSMVSDDYKDDKGNIISKTNPYRDSLRAMLRHPKWGFADMVDNADKIRDEIDHSNKTTPKVNPTTEKKAESFGELLESSEDSAANPNITEKDAEKEDSGKDPVLSTLIKPKDQVDPEVDPVPIESAAEGAIQVAADLSSGVDTRPPDLSAKAQGEIKKAPDLINVGGEQRLIGVNDAITTFLLANSHYSLGAPHSIDTNANPMYYSKEQMDQMATEAAAGWNNLKMSVKEFFKGPWDVTKIIPDFDGKSAPQALQSMTVMDGIARTNPWVKDLPEDKKPIVGMIEEAMFEARPPDMSGSLSGDIKYQPSLAVAGAVTSVMPSRRKFNTPIVSTKDLTNKKMVEKRVANFNNFPLMHDAMQQGRWKDAYAELVKSSIGKTLLSTESGRNRLNFIRQMATGKADYTYTLTGQSKVSYTQPGTSSTEILSTSRKDEIKAEDEAKPVVVGGQLRDEAGNLIMKPMPGVVYDGQVNAGEFKTKTLKASNIRRRMPPGDAVNLAWKNLTLAGDNNSSTVLAEDVFPVLEKNKRVLNYSTIQEAIEKNKIP